MNAFDNPNVQWVLSGKSENDPVINRISFSDSNS